jgi:hypothetical protein
MRERKVYDDAPEVELLGLGFIAYANVLGTHRRISRQLLERAGIADPQPGDWYRRQVILDVLREVERQGDQPTLFQVGKELANFTALPAEVISFEHVLEGSSAIYPQYQRNLPAYDFIEVERDGAAWRYVYHTPWPSQGIRGWLWQMFRKFQPGQLLQVELIEGAEDDFARTFRLSWQR